MSSLKSTIIAALIVLLPLGIVFGQNPCSKKLNEAINNYQAGNLPEALKLIEPCIKSDAFASESEYLQAMRLSILIYLYKDQHTIATETMEDMLRHYPEYEIIPEEEPAEYVNLYNSFLVKPRIRLGLVASGNMNIAQAYSKKRAHDLSLKYAQHSLNIRSNILNTTS